LSEFLITFDPPLPAAAAIDPPSKFDDLDPVAVAAGYATEHDIRYVIDGRVFAYYPASILTVLNDVHLEWTLIRERSTHDITLSGYTVLEAIFERGGFQFRSPAWPPDPVGERFDPDCLEAKFREAAAEVWGVVRSIQDGEIRGVTS
jgi:hypothetical protein